MAAMIMHWPGRIPAGQVLSEPCAAMDLFPNLATESFQPRPVLGLSILPVLATGIAWVCFRRRPNRGDSILYMAWWVGLLVTVAIFFIDSRYRNI